MEYSILNNIPVGWKTDLLIATPTSWRVYLKFLWICEKMSKSLGFGVEPCKLDSLN
jgi:hypothetical protein